MWTCIKFGASLIWGKEGKNRESEIAGYWITCFVGVWTEPTRRSEWPIGFARAIDAIIGTYSWQKRLNEINVSSPGFKEIK